MTTMCSYGTWHNWMPSEGISPDQCVSEAIGNDFDEDVIDAVTKDWKDAINAALPPEVSLCGDQFYGPYDDHDPHWTGYPVCTTEKWDAEGEPLESLDIAAIVESVDFWAIVERHDPDSKAQQL
jgi:hypothetical protein